MSDDQRACIRNLVDALKDADKATITVPSVVKADWGGISTELRILRDGDVARGALLRGLFESVGFPVKLVDLSASWDGAEKGEAEHLRSMVRRGRDAARLHRAGTLRRRQEQRQGRWRRLASRRKKRVSTYVSWKYRFPNRGSM